MTAIPRRSPKLAPGYSREDVRDSIETLESRPYVPEGTPSSSSDDGYEGAIKADGSYAYFYRNGSWKRAALSSW